MVIFLDFLGLYLMPCMLWLVHMRILFLLRNLELIRWCINYLRWIIFFSWGIPLFDAEYTPGLQDYILNGVPLEDFGNGHPDPNLTYVNQSSNEEYARSAILTSC